MTIATHVQAMHSGRLDRRFGVLVRQALLAAFVALCLPSVASAQTANLWIDTNGGTCTRQSAAGAYSDAAACASIQAAIAACAAGDTIRMKTGAYGAQTITATKTAPGCTVIAEASTSIGALSTGGAWYELQNITSTGSGTLSTPTLLWRATGANITCRNCNFSNGQVNWDAPSTNVNWVGGSLRNMTCTGGCDHGMGVYGSNNLTVDGVTFDKIVGDGGGGQHFEVIRVDGNINGLTVRNSKFTNNVTSTSTIFFSTWGGVKPRNLLFENNFFGSSAPAYFHFQMNFQNLSNCSDWTFRYNTFTGGQGIIPEPQWGFCGSGFSNVVFVGNLMPSGECVGTSMRYNVSYGTGSACSGTGNTVTTTSGAALGGTGGFYLQAGSAAIDAGAPAGPDCIATDRDGNSRPAGVRCDAGAHEYGGAAALAPPRSLIVQ
jgi:hypothetical protein